MFDGWMFGKRNFHFARFDAIPADFHLMVAASHEFKISIGKISSKIAGFIKRGIFIERIANEFFGC